MVILEAEDKRLNQSIVLEPDSVAHFKPESGQVIVGEIETYPEQNRPAVAKIIEVLGDYADSGMEIEIAVRKHHLPHQSIFISCTVDIKTIIKTCYLIGYMML